MNRKRKGWIVGIVVVALIFVNLINSFVCGVIAKLSPAFVPKIFQTDIFGTGISPFYWPVVWMLIPVLVYIPLFYAAVSAPFDQSFQQKVKRCLSGKKDAE